MEHLLGNLLKEADEREEALLLNLHRRLLAIRASQADLRQNRDYLLSLTKQTEQ